MAFQVMLVYWGSQVALAMTEAGCSGTGGRIAAAANTAHHTALTVRGKTMIPAAPSCFAFAATRSRRGMGRK
eukprot:2508997-Rhodomonas_salina.1